MRRAFLLASGVASGPLFFSGALRAEDLVVGDLHWTGARPTFPLFRGALLGDFKGEIEVRISTRSDPNRYRAHLAYFRLASALGSSLVPRTAVYAVRLPLLLAALRGDPVGLTLLRDEMAILNDGTVMVLVNEAPKGREIEFTTAAEVRAGRAGAEDRSDLSSGRLGLSSAYVETLVLDYLAGNVRRNQVIVDTRQASLRLVENGGAFAERPDAHAVDAILAQLKRVTKFSRRLTSKLRAFDRPKADEALHAGSFASWLVPSRPIAEMMERKQAVLSLVDGRIAEQGEASALAFP